MAAIVARDYFCRRLAPLQARPQPALFYTGVGDSCRHVHGADFEFFDDIVTTWMEQAPTTEEGAAGALPDGIQALCVDPVWHVVLDSMPEVNAQGLVPELAPPGNEEGSSSGVGVAVVLSSDECSSDMAARARSPVTIDCQPLLAPEGMLEPWGKAKRVCSPSPLPVGSSFTSPPSSPPPRPGDAGQGCSATVETGSTSGKPSSLKRPWLQPISWRFAVLGFRLGFGLLNPQVSLRARLLSF